jgi:hypothetical protein
MIMKDRELKVTQERIQRFQGILAQLRVTASPQEFPYVAIGFVDRSLEENHGVCHHDRFSVRHSRSALPDAPSEPPSIPP